MNNAVQAAREALNRFCEDKQRMCVPAQPDDDDMVISYALDKLELLQQMQKEQSLEIGYLQHRVRVITENYIKLFIDHFNAMDTYLPEWRIFAESEINKLKELLCE